MTAEQQRQLRAADCEVRFDPLTRRLYATDASIYQIEPVGVAFPRNAAQASAVIRAAAEAGIPLIPRGAGTGLVGGAIGEGLVVDFARWNRQITQLDREKQTVRVGAGVVLDALNAFLRPHGLAFGPDVATSSRATLGGMIANNSSGARAPVYGTTADHVASLEIVLTDGRIETVGPGRDALPAQRARAAQLVQAHRAEIERRMPPGLPKRWPGYALDRWLRAPGDLTQLLAGSEGTLAAIMSAELRLAALPREKGLGLIFFGSLAEAMEATVELLDLKPAAIEHIDRVLFDQTRGQRAFQAARDLLELEGRPCESILMVEFYEQVDDRLAALAAKRLGIRHKLLRGAEEMNLVWALRKAGLALLTGCKGPAKPVTGIEDTVVPPEQLPAYVAGLQSILQPLGLPACFYGHAASGLLHVRPVLDLHDAEDVRKFRRVAEEVSALVLQFKGSLAGEHGVGMARTEFLRAHAGQALLGVMREIKSAFDPHHLFNPGKVLEPANGSPPFRIDRHLRLDAGGELRLPFEPRLAYARKDGSFVAHLEQCNGCGGCRKETPTMCPTFLATGEEIMSTRGRANVIRAALETRGTGDELPLGAADLEAALSHCLACKACANECPSNVNMALLKAELLHARHRREGLPWRARLFSAVDLLGRLGCAAPRLANAALANRWLRRLAEQTLGLKATRPLPRYAAQRFDRWFAKRQPASQPATSDESQAQVGRTASHEPPPERGRLARENPIFSTDSRASRPRSRFMAPRRDARIVEAPHPPPSHAATARGQVLLWDDCFVRYHEPHIGQAAVAVLAAAGFEVQLLRSRRCCGRPAFSQGHLDEAARCGRHNLELLTDRAASGADTLPILFLEPSCYSMFAEDYRELKLAGAESVAARSWLFEQFVADLLEKEPEALRFHPRVERVALHAHCHAKSLLQVAFMTRLLQRLPGRTPTLLDTGCCGMAGAFGALTEHYDLSLKVAQPLVDKINAQPAGTVLVASGTSCRHQIEHLTPIRPRHLAEVLAAAL